jgi:predicted site-specific integrase-resolvase
MAQAVGVQSIVFSGVSSHQKGTLSNQVEVATRNYVAESTVKEGGLVIKNTKRIRIKPRRTELDKKCVIYGFVRP